MNLIFRATVASSLVLMLLCVGAILIGQSHSAQIDLFRYLVLCDGQPCYLGVVPGKTAWDETLTTFENQANMKFDPDTNIAANPAGFRGSMLIFASRRNEFVAEIDLTLRSTDINTGIIVDQFGAPCAVVVTPVGQIGLIYPAMSVIILSDQLSVDQSIQPTTVIHQINLFNRAQSCDQVFGIQFLSWRGFKHYTN